MLCVEPLSEIQLEMYNSDEQKQRKGNVPSTFSCTGENYCRSVAESVILTLRILDRKKVDYLWKKYNWPKFEQYTERALE